MPNKILEVHEKLYFYCVLPYFPLLKSPRLSIPNKVPCIRDGFLVDVASLLFRLFSELFALQCPRRG